MLVRSETHEKRKGEQFAEIGGTAGTAMQGVKKNTGELAFSFKAQGAFPASHESSSWKLSV